MRLRLGRPCTALIVAPHPDDEVIGAAGLIRALVNRGTRVRVLVVSDGAASHTGSRLWPRRRLVAARMAES
ncbi:PIG-L family deacetylase, partial [Sphingomonas solaris]